MTRIDFYHDVDDKLQFACRLTAKAVEQKLRVLIFAPDGALAKKLDYLLWTWPPIGFLPHCQVGDALAADTQVLLACDQNADDRALPHDEVLLNLDHVQPAFFSRFQRLIEIVSRDDGDRAPARERFRYYRDRGYEIHRHDMSKVSGAGG
jgi:DNA polymerase-3 subunit chi